MLPFLIPLFVLEVALMVIALVDLVKRERVRGSNKVVWALVIIFISIIGPIVYLLLGRGEGTVDGD
ncbi:MAG: PLDc N-terminal domain-containing protein [Dehalococcoidales bacterium]|jgi:hypothetical protein|nr:PLDc N-terminal domain-containing protein [Dehalococcoidales bacterium]